MKPEILSHFCDKKDPGIDRKKSHPWENIILITIAALICGAETRDEIEDFGYVKFDGLSGFLNMQNGVLSHDTFNRFFSLLEPKELEKHFISWTQSIVSKYDCEFVSVDGKTLCGASKMLDNGSIHIVNAWASLNAVALGQFKTSEKSNEITAIPALLDSLFLENCIVSIDAMGCQKKIAEKIREKKADYILSVKENHPTLYEKVRSSFSSLQAEEMSMPIEADHGRIENRKYFLIKNLNHITEAGEWQDLKSLVKVESERIIKKTGEERRESRYFITSLADMEKSAQGIRLHWGVENKLHWCVDVVMNEDKSSKRHGHVAENFSMLNKLVLKLLRKGERKISLRRKRKIAGWDHNYLWAILGFVKR